MGVCIGKEKGSKNALRQDKKKAQVKEIMISLRQPANLVIMGTFEGSVSQSLLQLSLPLLASTC